MCKNGLPTAVNKLALQLKCRLFDPSHRQSFRWDWKSRSRLHDLAVSGTLKLKTPCKIMSRVMGKPVYAIYEQYPGNLISAFNFKTVAQQDGLNSTWSYTSKTGFLMTELKWSNMANTFTLQNLSWKPDNHKRQSKLDRVKRIWYLSPMRAAKVQASLRIRAVSPEPSLLAHTISESRGTFRQKAISLAPLNGWACAVKICHDGMLEDTNSLDGAQLKWYTVSVLFSKTSDITVQTLHWFWNQYYVWASSRDYGTYHIADQRRLRRACASAGSDQKSDI